MTGTVYTHSRPVFDARDVDYLVSNLSEAELRQELRKHDVQRAFTVAEKWPNYLGAENYFWFDYGGAVELALDVVRANKLRPKPARGKIDPQEIKARVDIVAEIGRYTQLHKSGKHFVGCCPIHSEKHASFTVYPDEQRWHCFGCGQNGDVIDFIMVMERLDFKEAVATLGRS